MSGIARGFATLPRTGQLTLGAVVVVGSMWHLVVGAAFVGAATSAQPELVPRAAPASAGDPSAGPATSSVTTSAESTPASPAPSAEPSDTAPVTYTERESVVEVVTFEQVTRDDPARERGTREVVTAGRNGERTLTYEITYTDGEETARELVNERITKEPVDEVLAVGTREPPPAPAPAPAPEPPPAAAGDDCDPNYSGGCVPVASDVDCAGGSGNGPAYVAGPVRVVGDDVYGLDADGDGTGCE